MLYIPLFPLSNLTNTLEKPTYVAFIDNSTAHPSVHRNGLSSALLKNDIQGHMWHHLRARFDKTTLRVLHTSLPAHQTVEILRGLPEGPILFGIFVTQVADRLHGTSSQIPTRLFTLFNYHPPNLHALGSTTQIWIKGPPYVDDS